MWETIELREIRVFLTLAEELHFGHTAERLGLTQSRVSQSLRELEEKLGQRLVHRTSRRVVLTEAGERFRARAGAAYDGLAEVLRDTAESARALEGTLRLGLLNAASGGPHMVAIIAAFEDRYPECGVKIVQLPVRDRYEVLRRGEVDVMATRVPLGLPDLVIGPRLSREPRVLAVARGGPLGARESVVVEDLADHEVPDVSGVLPPALAEAMVPAETPGGRPIRRRRVRIDDLSELVMHVARGRIVHPTVASFGEYFRHQDVVYVPISDLPPLESALVWRRRNPDPRLRAFVAVAREVLRPAATRAGRSARTPR